MVPSDVQTYPPKGIGAVVLAGGQGLRMGGMPKAGIEIGTMPILSRLMDILSPQVEHMAISVRGDNRLSTTLPALQDDLNFEGPLSGLLSALRWGCESGLPLILTVPSDTPFIPADLVLRLAHGLRRGPAAIAVSSGRRHPVVGLWPTSCLGNLQAWLDRGESGRIGEFARSLGAAQVEWPELPRDPFLNVNTPEDRDRAETLSGTRSLLAGTVLFADGVSSETLLTDFAAWARSAGLSVGGLLQRSSLTGPGGAREFFMVDLETGQSIPITQRLGQTTSCSIDTRAMTGASSSLRAAIERRPDLVIVNKFGHLEMEGAGMIDEMLSVMSHDLPLLTSVTESRLDSWLNRCGGLAELLPPELPALKAWWARTAGF